MAGDIEEFLRRAAERRKQQQGRKGPIGGPSQQRPVEPPARKPPPPPVRPNVVIDAEIIEAEPVTGDDVAADVARHLDTREFSQRTSQLGEGVRRETQAMQSHITEDLGTGPSGRIKPSGAGVFSSVETTIQTSADGATQVTGVPQNNLALSIAAMMRDPQSIRQAIVLNEVFSRPIERW